MSQKLSSFHPVINNHAQILILGSMPGSISLEKNEYYAHPRNLFWKIIESTFDIPLELTYGKRIDRLIYNKLALWDVLQHCQRKGSLDSNIMTTSEEANNFLAFFEHYNHIKRICFNGTKAFNAFKKHILKNNPSVSDQYQLITLPSTSPANASIPTSIKYEKWKDALDFSTL